MRIELHRQRGYRWQASDGVHVAGYVLLGEEVLDAATLARLMVDIREEAAFAAFVMRLKGCFALVRVTGDQCWICCDHIRSIPVMWSVCDGEYIVSDSYRAFENRVVSTEAEEEFFATGYVTGSETLFKGVNQIGVGEWVLLRDGHGARRSRYFGFRYCGRAGGRKDHLDEMANVYDSMAKRLVNLLRGRAVVLPLSGGHDSRLLAYLLHKQGYQNVITYTYGRALNAESRTSRRVADYLAFRWHFIEYRNQELRDMYSNASEYAAMADYCGNGFTVPLIQEWRAVKCLAEGGELPEGAVFVPGYSNDFLAGSHLQGDSYYSEGAVPVIIREHYRCWAWYRCRRAGHFRSAFRKRVERVLHEIGAQEWQGEDQVAEQCEAFDYHERQAKHITNAVRMYEFYGYKWLLPFWDREVIDYWRSLPGDERSGRSLFLEYTKKEYGDLMRVAPVFAPRLHQIKQRLPKNRLVLWIAYALRFLMQAVAAKRTHFLNYYGYVSWREYWGAIVGFGTTSYYFMFSHRYLDYLRHRLADSEMWDSGDGHVRESTEK